MNAKPKYCIACEEKKIARFTVLINGVKCNLCKKHYKEYLEQERILNLINNESSTKE